MSVCDSDLNYYCQFLLRIIYLLTDNPNVERLATLLYRWAKVSAPILLCYASITFCFAG